MKKAILFLTFVLISCANYGQVVINEFDTDTPGTDIQEFIELKSTTANFSLNGYVLVFFNGSSGGNNQSYLALDLDGLTTDINGIATIGNDAVSGSIPI